MKERDAEALLRAAIRSQYHAALGMLRQAIERCPDGLWNSAEYVNPFWRIAYHALYYAHLYVQPHQRAFRPWARHQTGIQHMDGVPGPPELEDDLELPHRPPRTGEPYTRAELLEYCSVCDGLIDQTVDRLDLADPDCGFTWKTRSRVEHQLVSIRHVQHHASQLAERLRSATGIGVDWR